MKAHIETYCHALCFLNSVFMEKDTLCAIIAALRNQGKTMTTPRYETVSQLFPARLRQKRTAARMTIQQLATAAGLTRSAVQNYEIGSREPSIKIIMCLADTLGVAAAWLAGLSEFEGDDDSRMFITARPDILGKVTSKDDSIAFNAADLKQRGYSRDQIALIKVNDNLLAPDISQGDEVLLDTTVKTITERAMYAIKDGELLSVRWGRKEAGSNIVVIYAEDERHFPPLRFEAGDLPVEIVGKAIGIWKYI